MSHANSSAPRWRIFSCGGALLALSLVAAGFTVLISDASPASAGVASVGRTLPATIALSAHDAAPGSWSDAAEVPGSATLNAGNNAGVYSISCSISGYCSAGGNYTDGAGASQAFVVRETNGTWGSAVEVPGTAQLNSGGDASVQSVSCSSAVYCGAVGFYTDSSGGVHGFVVSENGGTWGAASEVVDPLAIESTAALGAESISCTSTGSCTAVGDDVVSNGNSVGFEVSETNGAWGDAVEFTIASSFGNGGTSLDTVSCSSPSNCSAAGNGLYPDSAISGGFANIPFVVDETFGTWGTPMNFPGLATLNVGLAAVAAAISCSAPGNCGAGGTYADGSNTAQAFVANETDGKWGDAVEIPGSSSINVGGAVLSSLSCPSNGDCGAAGQYTDALGNGQAFVANETNGSWSNVEEIPGSSSLFTEGIGPNPVALSCGTPNNCSAGGVYFDSSGNGQAFVVNEVAGSWGSAIEVPGTGPLNSAGGAFVSSISCGGDSSCGAGGWYSTGSQEFQAFTSNMAPLFSTQAALRLTSVHGVAGVALKLTTSGGSGTGKLSFSVQSGPAEHCVVTGDVLRATNRGVCVVTATRSGDATYLPTTSVSAVSFVLPSKPRPLTLSFIGSSSELSRAAKSELAILLKKLIPNASITITGFANGNPRLAKIRAVAVEDYLVKNLKLHVVIETKTTTGSSAVTVVTSKE